MSTIKVDTINDASGGSAAVLYGVASPPNSMGFRNRIINGEMRIDQRNAGASVTVGGTQTFYVDRFAGEKANLSTLVANGQQVADAPAGFRNSLKITVTTAEASGASSSFVGADQRIEGFNFADMAFGTASAQTFTLSFWVKSSVTGTYPVSFFNASVNRAYLATYSISSANTWEYKTITVAGDSSGTWNTTNGIGLGFQFSLGGGTNSDGTAGSWGGTYKSRTSACVNLNATVNATWQITGVQLEAGTVASPFERRDYGRELMMCQRYLPVINAVAGSSGFVGTGLAQSSSQGNVYVPFKVTARVPPNGLTAVTVGSFGFTTQAAAGSGTSAAFTAATTEGANFYININNSTLTTGQVGFMTTSGAAGVIYFTGCEL
jgi:hypothetical protein